MTMAISDLAVKELQELGLTETEASVYVALLQTDDATGYRIGQLVGKATPNAYKALHSLRVKGGAIAIEGEPTRWRAVPVDELVATARARYERASQTVIDKLRNVAVRPARDQLVELENFDQAMVRARAMIERAERVILIDSFPTLLEPLVGALQTAAKRQVKVVAKVYATLEIEDVMTVQPPDAEEVLRTWPGAQMALAVDGREMLTVMTDRQGARLHRALWSDSLFVACLFHNYVASEVDLAWYEREHERLSPGQPSGVAGIHLTHGAAPGLDELAALLRTEGDR